MATQTGYKTSELGEIPQDWDVVELGEVLNPILNKKVSESFFTFIGMQDVSEEAKIINQTILPISQLRSGLTYFEKNDVLVAKITPCFENGKGGYANNLKTEIGFGSTEFHILRANRRADAEFIYYWTINPKFRQQLTLDMVGSAGHKRVPFQALHKFKISLPPLPEQTAIATALSDTDALIGSLKTLIAKKQAVKLAAMQNLLGGKIRLPEFAQRPDGSLKSTCQTELGCVPEDWEVVELGEVCDILSGINLSQNSKGSYPVTRIETIANGNIDLNRIGYVETSQDIENYKLNYGDILFSNINSLDHIGKTAFYSACYELYHGTNLLRLVAKNINAKFLFENLNSKPQRIFFQKIANQAVSQASINRTQLSKTLILKPKSIPEQTAIAQLLSDMDAEIEALECRLKKTQSLKQGMMQALLSGKIRLPLK